MKKYQKARLDAALNYAKRGWRVLPVSGKKHPINENGSKGATTDVTQITQWFTDREFTNIGVATGPESFFVVDIDVKNGKDGLNALYNEFGESGVEIDTDRDLLAITASGGMHLLYKYPTGMTVHNAVNVLDGVDIRGDGGYIVVAPSSVKIGDEYVGYRWINHNGVIPEAPEWALRLLEKKPTTATTGRVNSTARIPGIKRLSNGLDIHSIVTGVAEGQRDDSLWKLACSLAARNVPIDRGLMMVLEAAAHCIPPFDPRLAEDKVMRAYEKYASTAAIAVSLKRIDDEITRRRGVTL